MSTVSVGSLYIAGFAQSGAPHAGLIIAGENGTKGQMAHIYIKEGTWAYQHKPMYIVGSMTLTTLLKIHDVSAGAITTEQLFSVAQEVPVPAGGESGECLPWVLRVVESLAANGLVSLSSSEELGNEFTEFAAGNRAYANRNTHPNVKTSVNCA